MKHLLFGLLTIVVAANFARATEPFSYPTEPIPNTAATGAGIAEPPVPLGDSIVEPPVPPANDGFVEPPIPRAIDTGGFIEPAMPEEPAFAYRYIDAGYVYHDIDPSLSTGAGNGAGFRFLHDLSGPLFFTGSFRWSAADKVDRIGATAGLGAFLEIKERFHLTLDGGGAWDKTKGAGPLSSSDSGFYVGPGIRLKFRQGIELFGHAYYRDVRETGWFFRGGAVIDLKPKLDLTLAGEFDDVENVYFAGLRYFY